MALAISGVLTQLHAAGQTSGAKGPRKIKDVSPVYPATSLAAGDEGVVLVELQVDTSGLVTSARVLWSKCQALDGAALTAVRGWRYEAQRLNGKPTPFSLVTQVPFRLPEKLKSRAGSPGSCKWIDPPKPTT